MSDAGIAALKLAMESHRDWAHVCAIFLIGGLFGEVAIALWFREGRSLLETILAVLLALVVAGAVLGEVVFGDWADDAADALQRNSDEKVAALHLKASKLEADNLKRREENLKLAERLRSRWLDGKAFVAALRGVVPPTSVRILYKPGDTEAFEFALQIHRWLGVGEKNDGARWPVSDPQPIPEGSGHPFFKSNVPDATRWGADATGLGIAWRGTAEQLKQLSEEAAPRALQWAFRTVRFATQAIISVNEPDDGVTIVIGQKP